MYPLALSCPLWYVKRPCNITIWQTYVCALDMWAINWDLPSILQLQGSSWHLLKLWGFTRIFCLTLELYYLILFCFGLVLLLFHKVLLNFTIECDSSIFLHIIFILAKPFIEKLHYICLKCYLISRVWRLYIINCSLKIKHWQSIVNSK